MRNSLFLGLKAHVLDFSGMAKIPAKNNFILCGEGSRAKELDNVLLMGKESDREYNLAISWPMSIIQAYAIAVSSFGLKIGC